MRFWITCLAVVSVGCVFDAGLEKDSGSGPEKDSGSGPEDSGSGPGGEDSGSGPEDEDEDEPGTMFVPYLDVSPNPLACDPSFPDCDPGLKCTLVRDPDTSDFVGRCVPIAEQTVALGERCVPLGELGHDNCEDGTVCWDIMNGEGTCLGFCQGGPDVASCDDAFVCNWGKSSAAGLCTPICDPLSTAECPETCGCYWANNGFFCLPRTSNIPVGEPCGFINDCAPLHLCASAEALPDCEGSACCAAYCDLDDASNCGEGTDCVAFFEDGAAPPSYEHVGVCIAPGA